ncbi:OstA-like protein [Tenacibaculum sp. C7A-26P2]|uniref:OstA-like protein n=1 Tax=Tenacibaculum sp. C7A-26P2 TaxID=3447504 RepID=UPI003F860048
MKRLIVLFLLLYSVDNFSQTKKIKVLSSEYSETDENKYPGATVLLGNVKIAHEGATLECKQALLYKKKNLFKAAGEVIIEQGDSITQYSDFALYNGDTKKATSWGNVEVNDKEMKMSTDTLYFDRKEQVLFYKSGGIINDKENTLKSKVGTYYLEKKKFSAKSKVTVLNKQHFLESNHLDYYTNSNFVYLYGPSTITNLKDSTKVYSERGFYDTNTEISYFVKRAKLFLKDRTVEADSLYYDKRKGFASATNKIKVIDTIQNMVTKGNYAELFEEKDSLFITDKAVAISVHEKDSMYIHGDKILVTGKSKERIIRIFNDVKIFKSNLQGKCDSIHTSQISSLTQMFQNPILWSGKSQITGDTIQLLSDNQTNKLDSLFVRKNGFIIEKDSLAIDDFNQIKGRDIFGKFDGNDLRTMLVKGNAESLYFNRSDKTKKLETITKEIASDIEFTLEDNQITQTKYFKKSEGKTFPPSEFPVDKKKFNGFIWRGDEQPLTMEDIFLNDKENGKIKNPKVNLKNSRDNINKVKKQLSEEFKKKQKSTDYKFSKE